MTKEEIQELLKQSPSGSLWSYSGQPLYVDRNGDLFWVNDNVSAGDSDVYPLPPLLREDRGESPAPFETVDVLKQLLDVARKTYTHLKNLPFPHDRMLGESLERAVEYVEKADILLCHVQTMRDNDAMLKKAVELEDQLAKARLAEAQKPAKLKLTPCSEPPDDADDVLIWSDNRCLGIAYHYPNSKIWFARFVAQDGWPKRCHWSELPEVER